MTFTISSITRCPGTNHITVTGTVNGVARSVKFLASDLTVDPQNDGIVDSAVARCRSAVKESGATTLQQISSALVGPTFQV